MFKISTETGDEVVVEARCPSCGKSRAIKVSKRGLEAWLNGDLIQRALPQLNPSEREALMTGLCDECFPS